MSNKKIISYFFILISLIILSCFSTKNTYAFSGIGNGSSGNPYQITTCTQLQEMEDSLDSSYILENDIDCDGFDWTPIATGMTEGAFTGLLDGNYKVIDNLSYLIVSGDIYVGLFGKIDAAEIKNLYIKNISIQDKVSGQSSRNVGALAGISGMIDSDQLGLGGDIINNVHVIGGSVKGMDYVGGLIGAVMRSNDSIIYSSSSANIFGDNIMGGLLGSCSGTVTDSFAFGDVGHDDNITVGGLIGELKTGANVQRSFATGDVSGDDEIGGFVGQISSTSPATDTSLIKNCYSSGDVIESNSNRDGIDIGAFVGIVNSGTIESSYSLGVVDSGDPSTTSGGFCGELSEDGLITTNSYWNAVNTGLVSNDIGTSLTTSQMKLAGNFSEWDFTSVWKIDSNSILNDGYPLLRPNIQNFVFSASQSVEASSSITISSANEDGSTLWFAPFGTTTFSESSTMTKTSGLSTSINAPSTSGIYSLYILDSENNISYPSYLALTVTSSSSPASSTNNNSPSTWSAPGCNDVKPLSAPDLFQINVTQNMAKLFFTPISNTNQYFISFSTNSNAEEHGAAITLTREGVQNFTINLLKPNTSYYFKVRGQNGCMPGEWSNIFRVSTRPLGINQFTPFYKKIYSTKKFFSLNTAKPTSKIENLQSNTEINTSSIVSPSPTPPPQKRCFLWWCF